MQPILLLSILFSNGAIIPAVVITTFGSKYQLENIYMQRVTQGYEDPFVHLDDENKEKQCAEVLGSRYFRNILKREYADKNDQEVKDYVQMQDTKYIALHYKVTKNGKNSIPIYPYSLFRVQVTNGLEIQKQLMFPCLSRHLVTRRIVDYFISYAFKENERFLYGSSRQPTALEVQALIELAPTAFSSDDMDNIESFYLEASGDTAHNTATLEDDQLCNLNESSKRRVCSLVFDSQVYAKDYVFYDSAINIESKCKTKKIKFEKVSGKKKIRAYAHVFKCFVNRLNPHFSSEVRYLANGFHENSVFVMIRSGRKVVIETYVPFVSVLAENFIQDTDVQPKRRSALNRIKSIPRCIYHSFSAILDNVGK